MTAMWYFVSMTFSPKSSPISPTVSMYSSMTPCCRVRVILCFLQPISLALPVVVSRFALSCVFRVAIFCSTQSSYRHSSCIWFRLSAAFGIIKCIQNSEPIQDPRCSRLQDPCNNWNYLASMTMTL